VAAVVQTQQQQMRMEQTERLHLLLVRQQHMLLVAAGLHILDIRQELEVQAELAELVDKA
jgi:hypothetical protein